MSLSADRNLTLTSHQGELRLDAAEGITLVSRGAYIKLKDGSIEIGAPGELRIRNDLVNWGGAASLEGALAPVVINDPVYQQPKKGRFRISDKASGAVKADVHYRIKAADGSEVRGVTDSEGYTQRHYGLDMHDIEVFLDEQGA